jgi:hypothetical protein
MGPVTTIGVQATANAFSFSNVASNPMSPVPGLPTLTYTVPPNANRILATWSFECNAPNTLATNDRIYASISSSAGTPIGPNEDEVVCEDQAAILGTSIQRAFDVTPGSTVVLSGIARVNSGTGTIDDSYMTVVAGSQ